MTQQEAMHNFVREVMGASALEVKLQSSHLNAEVNANSPEIEENIRRIRLAEVKRMKLELEQKLAIISNKEMKLCHGAMVRHKRHLSKEDKKKYEEELDEKRKEATEFIQTINAQKRERYRKEHERQRLIEEKRQKEEEEQRRKLKEREEEMLRRRKEEMMKVYENIKKKREEELRRREETQASVTLPTEESYLYKKLEERYNNDVLLPILEEKKKELAKKRSHFKSLNKEELEDHIKKYDLLMAQKEEARKNELKMRKKREQILHMEMTKFQTPVLHRQNLLRTIAKQEEEKRQQEKKEKRERLSRFLEQVRSSHPVKISSTKVEELKKQIDKLRHPVRKTRDTRKDYDLAKINNRSLGAMSETHSDEKTSSEKRRHSHASRKHHTGNKVLEKLSATIEEKSTASLPRKDYLAEMRKQKEKSKAKRAKYDWTNDIHDRNLNSIEKYNKVVEKANLIEEQAKRKEQMLRAKGGTEKDPDMGEVVSDMFIDAIKAKLAVLENL
eukprot:TRINITY_DN4500_c0_g4_i1.p1 TRINITY_DN4500_c0_g4~~TRINITY_DN4500_c0_g4_i1.p1  ORF type:complete len:502 (+),score=191.90 TRINITY_DN4500_c0_g4_i1:341-1846(+)